jgi:hypothetical protein
MSDLKIARKVLKEKKISIVIVKKEKILFESNLSGINGLLQAIKTLKGFQGASVADKVVGRAAALLLVSSLVHEVFAETLSFEGEKILKENSISVKYNHLVPIILNKEYKDICPFEKFSLSIEIPEEAYEKLSIFVETLKKQR